MIQLGTKPHASGANFQFSASGSAQFWQIQPASPTKLPLHIKPPRNRHHDCCVESRWPHVRQLPRPPPRATFFHVARPANEDPRDQLANVELRAATTATWPSRAGLSAAASRRTRDSLPSDVARPSCVSPAGRYVLVRRRQLRAARLTGNTSIERQAGRAEEPELCQRRPHGRAGFLIDELTRRETVGRAGRRAA